MKSILIIAVMLCASVCQADERSVITDNLEVGQQVSLKEVGDKYTIYIHIYKNGLIPMKTSIYSITKITTTYVVIQDDYKVNEIIIPVWSIRSINKIKLSINKTNPE